MTAFVSGIRAWAARLETGQRHVFDNLARYIDPTIALPSHMEEWLIELLHSGRIRPWRGRHYVVRGLQAYLCWTQLRELERVPDVDLADPYEPLIQFFEGGGAMYVEHGIFMDIYPNYVGFILEVPHPSPASPA